MKESQYQSFLDTLNQRFQQCYFRSEYTFALPARRYRFDIALKCCQLAIEIEGGATKGNGHRNIGGFLKDIDKYNLAAILGWRILRIRPIETKGTQVLDKIEDYLQRNPCKHGTLNQQLRRANL